MARKATHRGPTGQYQMTPEGAEQMRRIVELRNQDLTFTEIGAQIGIHKTNALRQYRRALAMVVAPAVDEHRAHVRAGYLTDLERLDDLFTDAVDGEDLQAAVAVVRERRRIFDSLAKLDGLNAPTRRVVEVITESLIDEAIRSELLAMEALDADNVGAGRSAVGEAPPTS